MKHQSGINIFSLLLSICVIITGLFVFDLVPWFSHDIDDSFKSQRRTIDLNTVYVVFISGYQSNTAGHALEQLNSTQAGGRSGMGALRNKFERYLSAHGVPAENFIYMRWTESAKNRFNYKIQPEYNQIVERLNSLNPSYLAIFGHSYGGCTAIRISRETIKTPDFIGLFDPVLVPAKVDFNLHRAYSAPQDSRADNYPKGRQIINWYQTRTWPKGVPDVYNSNLELVTNIDVKGVTHTSIDNSPTLQEEALRIVASDIGLLEPIN